MSSAPVPQNSSGHGSLESYVTGFLLALVLTIIPFWLVMTSAVPAPVLLPAVLALAAVQVSVHLRYFLHINSSAEGRWNLIALALAVLVAAVVVVGSLWVIWQLNSHMMPG